MHEFTALSAKVSMLLFHNFARAQQLDLRGPLLRLHVCHSDYLKEMLASVHITPQQQYVTLQQFSDSRGNPVSEVHTLLRVPVSTPQCVCILLRVVVRKTRNHAIYNIRSVKRDITATEGTLLAIWGCHCAIQRCSDACIGQGDDRTSVISAVFEAFVGEGSR